MRVVATATREAWGLTEEEEYISSDEEKKKIYKEFGWVKPYDDTKPLPPKGIAFDYEDGMSYPANRGIVKDGNIYRAKSKDALIALGNPDGKTSTTWIDGEFGEWDIKVRGLPLEP